MYNKSLRLYAMASKPQPVRPGPARFFDDLVRCETRLYNAMNDRLREKHGIVATQFEFLRYLRDHSDSRVADVAASFAAGIGAISKGTDRLEDRGWIKRLPNPADRRSSLLALTPRGLQLVTEAERTFTDHTNELLSTTLTPAQLDAATDALSLLRSALERDQIGTPTG
jgi:MarR family multiple antibiotic resistance transcriptional regulator